MSYSNTVYSVGEVLVDRDCEEFKVLKILNSIYVLKNLRSGNIVNYSKITIYLCFERKKLNNKYKIV